MSYATEDGSATAGTDYAAAVEDASRDHRRGRDVRDVHGGHDGGHGGGGERDLLGTAHRRESSPALATLKTSLGGMTVTIVDDDRLSVSVAGPRTVVEGSVATLLTVTVAGGAGSAAVVVDYSTSDSTATSGQGLHGAERQADHRGRARSRAGSRFGPPKTR